MKPVDPSVYRAQNTLIAISALIALVALCTRANAAQFSVQFRPLPKPAIAGEVLWQTENVIDLRQTLRISRNPQQWSEVGTMSPFTGPHPTKAQVWAFSVAFGLAHYGVSQLLENANMPRALAAWEGTSLGWKTWNMQRNARAGLGY